MGKVGGKGRKGAWVTKGVKHFVYNNKTSVTVVDPGFGRGGGGGGGG